LEGFGVGLVASFLKLAAKGRKPEGAHNLLQGRAHLLQKALTEAKPIDVEIMLDGKRMRGEFLGVEVMNIPFTGPGLPIGMKSDTFDPYHYVRLEPGSGDTEYLIVGGADHKTGEADDAAVRFEGLESWNRGLVPTLGRATHRWSGQVLEPLDYGGFIGRNPGSKNVYVATGDSGQGITHGVVASLLLSDLIMKGASPWHDLYEPSRKPLSAVQNFIAENATAIKNFAEYIAPGELSSIEELRPGQGAIIREGLSKIAAYRDDSGVLYRCSAACTHVGCHVHWNSLEVCWDCPCHGSHFAVDGTALSAPAISALAPK
jgi:hypothetical protein